MITRTAHLVRVRRAEANEQFNAMTQESAGSLAQQQNQQMLQRAMPKLGNEMRKGRGPRKES